MAVLNELEPKEVFRFFEEISAIPRGSRDTKRISDYLRKKGREVIIWWHLQRKET